MSMVTGTAVYKTNEQLVARIRAGENTAANMLQLWNQNKNFVFKMAMKYNEYAEHEDLMQEGYIGLCEAVRHYDADQGAQFISYAAFWIKQTMVRYIEDCGGVVRIPSYARQQLLKYKKIFREYKQWYGREPSEREMRAFLGISQEKLEDIKESLRMSKIQSLSKPIGGEDEEITLEDSVASVDELEEDVCKRLDYEIMEEALWNTVDNLPEEQANVIRKRYGEQKARGEIGCTVGMTDQQVRTLEYKALRTLRIPSKCEKFKSYYEEYLSAGPIYHVGVERFNRTWTSSVEAQLGL